MRETLSQRSWEWIKKQPDFHSHELAKEMDVSLHQAQMVIDHLKTLGAVETINSKAKPVVYAKVARAKPHLPGKNPTSPQPNSIRQRIWQAMRFLEVFTIPEVMGLAECSKSSVERYLTDLCRYEYVVKVGSFNKRAPMAKRRGWHNRYRLFNNTGHKYPVARKEGLFDQNLKRLIERPETAE